MSLASSCHVWSGTSYNQHDSCSPSAAAHSQHRHPQTESRLQALSRPVPWRRAVSSTPAAQAPRSLPPHLQRLHQLRQHFHVILHQGLVAVARWGRDHAMLALSWSASRAGCRTLRAGRALRHLRLRGWLAAGEEGCKCPRARAARTWGSWRIRGGRRGGSGACEGTLLPSRVSDMLSLVMSVRLIRGYHCNSVWQVWCSLVLDSSSWSWLLGDTVVMVTLLMFAYRLGRGMYAREHPIVALAALGRDEITLCFSWLPRILLTYNTCCDMKYCVISHIDGVDWAFGLLYLQPRRWQRPTRPHGPRTYSYLNQPWLRTSLQMLALSKPLFRLSWQFQPSKYSPSIVLQSSKVGGLLLILPTAPAVV